MRLKRTLFFASLACMILNPTLAYQREVTLTIDDLPFVGSTHNKPSRIKRENRRFTKVMDTLQANQVPATGFVVARTIESGQWKLLEAFHNNGNIIANHTYSHPNLNRTNSMSFIQNITKADRILKPLLSQPKYFRYPFLAEGRGKKKQTVIHFLSTHDYVIAPITIDSKDYRFNKRLLNIPWRKRKAHLNRIKRQYLAFIWRNTLQAEKKAQIKLHRPIKQILLIHMNSLNSYFIGDIIKLYRQHGYHFINLPDAMKDPYYSSLK